MQDLLMKRRSIRKYTKEPVPKETIDKVVMAALTSPSARNVKPWQLVVITDKKLLLDLSKSRGNASAHIKDAGFAITVLADASLTDMWIEDASIIATIIQLASESLNLGSCWVQMRDRVDASKNSVEDYVKEKLNIPESFRVECIIAIGYPDELKKPHEIEDLDLSKVHYNQFK